MKSNHLIRSIQLRNLLSYGPDSEPIELRSLNVLVGPNSSGKSNLFDAIEILRAAPTNLARPVQSSGGIADWLWKGGPSIPIAEIDVTVDYPRNRNMPLRHKLAFSMDSQRLEIEDEKIENSHPESDIFKDVRFYYRFSNGYPVLNVRQVPTGTDAKTASNANYIERRLEREEVKRDQSILSQRQDPSSYPEITFLRQQYANIKLYRDWNIGRNTLARSPQQTDLPNDFLLEDFSNLVLVLNSLELNVSSWQNVINSMKSLNPDFQDLSIKLQGGTGQLFMREEGASQPMLTPATRLSDGTLRFLCLIAVLCHPTPPPLICIEEPEIGLHPDILRVLADLLIQASERTQLIITTHSDILIDCFTQSPEDVIVCEKENGSTVLQRLRNSDLKEWLERYSLGYLWRKGEIGGNRW